MLKLMFFLVTFLGSLLTSNVALSVHPHIECEGTFHISCCDAISPSAGSQVQYLWAAGKGWYEFGDTTFVNWIVHHCWDSDRNGFSLTNKVRNNFSPFPPWEDWAQGFGNCAGP